MRIHNYLRLTMILFISLFAGSVFGQPQTTAQPKTTAKPTTKTGKSNTAKPKPPVPPPDTTTSATGLTMSITHHGAGVPAVVGKYVLVHYTGVLSSGVKFDSSLERKEPIAFKLGAGHVIKGWDEGIAKLRVGDQAVLVIPPTLAYGQRNVGDGLIPPGSTLVFVVELMDVKETSLSELLAKTLEEKGFDVVVSQFHEMQQTGLSMDVYAAESDFNSWGYRLIRQKKLKEAIGIFKLNVEAYPNSANVYDSLADAYAQNGDTQLAIENYEKALAIDPKSESAQKNLKKLKGN
jgi:FKBP-type peptidyl-prolyl cis-trans isomerase